MKKKTLLFAGFCALSLITLGIPAMSTTPVSISIQKSDIEDPPPGYEKIDLLGDLLYNIAPNAIIAGASDNAVYVGFNQTFGNVSISIFNSLGGLIYSIVVNTDIQQEIIIPLPTTTAGTYTVELNAFDGYADGEFELE